MSVVEWAVCLALVALAFAVGVLKGRASAKTSAKAAPEPERETRRPSAASPQPPRSAAKRAASSIAPPSHPARSLDRAGATSALAAVRSWGYQLQDLDLAQAAGSGCDLLVIDYAADGTDRTAFTPTEIARLQSKPDGSRRLVLAYLSVGEAESYRSYWRKAWSRRRPGWLLRENPDWDQSYAVRFWEAPWRALLHGSRTAYLDKILAQGFDGVYLDKCDVADDLRDREPKAAATRPDLEGDMVDLIRRLAAYARARRPGFLVVGQNAEPLLDRGELRRELDGVAKEELLFGLAAAEAANDPADIDWARERLDLVRGEGKPVLVVEYLNDAAKIREAAGVAQACGYVLYVSDKTRELDRLRLMPLEAQSV